MKLALHSPRAKYLRAVLFPLQYYDEVLGDDVGSLFSAEYGILISDGLHHPFDRGEWALWPDVSRSSAVMIGSDISLVTGR